MDRRQADVLVAAAVAGDEVLIEQLVVVVAGCGRRSGQCLSRVPRHRGVAGLRAWSPCRTAWWRCRRGTRRRFVSAGRVDRSPGSSGSPGTSRASGTSCGNPFGRRDEVAVRVGGHQRHRQDVHVVELDAEHSRGLGLDLVPGGQPPRRPGRPAACRSGRACRPSQSYSRRNTWCDGCEV